MCSASITTHRISRYRYASSVRSRRRDARYVSAATQLGEASHVTYERDELALKRTVDVREPLGFPASARLISSLDWQACRVERYGHDLLVEGKVSPTDIRDLPLVTAMHEPLFTGCGNSVLTAVFRVTVFRVTVFRVTAQHQVEDHHRILDGVVSACQLPATTGREPPRASARQRLHRGQPSRS